MPNVPELLLPLLAPRGITPDLTQFVPSPLKRYSDTKVIIISTNDNVSVTWEPEDKYAFLIFSLTFSPPRDYDTNEVVYNYNVGFWYRERNVSEWFWVPFLESSVKDINTLTFVMSRSPIDMVFYNYTSRAVRIDITMWAYLVAVDSLPEIIAYFNGIRRFFVEEGKI